VVASWLFFVFMERGEGFIAQRWCWRVSGTDATSTTASKSFATLKACQADAASHGFTSSDQVTIDSQGTDRYGRRHVPHFGERRAANLIEIE
jgi:endonuclease YncB( thermonuclease family)